MSKITLLYIPTTGTARVMQVANTLDSLQKLVGGLIEPVSLPTGHTIYCNEEGKLMGLPVNRRALVGSPGYTYTETLVGDLIVVGPTDDEGNDTSLSVDDTDAVKKHLGLRIVVPLMQTPEDRLRAAARAVVDTWEHGDLAGAVNYLRVTLDAIEHDEDDDYGNA